MDGTDEEEDGIWKFTSTDEEPYLPLAGGVLTGDRDCMVFISSDRAGQSGCDFGSHRAVFCESQGMYRIMPQGGGRGGLWLLLE